MVVVPTKTARAVVEVEPLLVEGLETLVEIMLEEMAVTEQPIQSLVHL
jgi:hypothetical protein